jgi:hypothetical protein
LVENQIDIAPTTTGTDPTSTLLNSYINTSIRLIARRDRPKELENSTVTQADITVNTNTASIPSTILIPQLVYYTASGGNIYPLIYKSLKKMIQQVPNKDFFDSTVTSDPNYYDVRGTSFIFDTHFDRTESNALKIYGVTYPTTLVNDSDTIELPTDYDMLIAYQTLILFYQRDDDVQNQAKYQNLAENERQQLRTFLDFNDESTIEMDPYTFNTGRSSLENDLILTRRS